MPSLIDAIRKNRSSAPPGVTDETAKAAKLFRAKSGKATGGAAVGPSNLAEQAAVGAAQTQYQQEVLPQQELAQQGLEQQQAGLEQEVGIRKAEATQARRGLNLKDKLRTEQLLNEFERDRGLLDLEKNRAQVNQFAQSLRLQNQSYIDKLQREGARNRLNSDIGFTEALATTTFGNAKNLFKKQLANKEILDADDREFSKATGQMTIEQARYVFNEDKKAAAARAPYEVIPIIATAGVEAASKAGTGEVA